MAGTRKSGILLHISSLPSKYGIGDLGENAKLFIDKLNHVGCKMWQILPLGPLGPGNSPYQAYSAYAIDSIYISIDELVHWKLLSEDQLRHKPIFNSKKVDYDKVRSWKESILEQAYLQFISRADKSFKIEYQKFIEEHLWWLNDYALYSLLKSQHNGECWNKWPEEQKLRLKDTLNEIREKHTDQLDYIYFKQFMAFRQWFQLKAYANSCNVEIFGDIPLYVSLDSSDVWGNQTLFQLDENGNPTQVGGVPPDYFSEDGQLWGNPLFNWEELQKSDYQWWIARLYFSLHLFDWVRIDHFRGLEAYWAIPANSDTAKNGHWEKAHGEQLLSIIGSRFDQLPIVAEDLGTITPEVEFLRDRFNLPGMKILQFAFDGDANNSYLPHNHVKNSLVYTGTHDNNTLVGWWKECTVSEKNEIRKYANIHHGNIAYRMLKLAWSSVANIAIAPLQDILLLDENARMNIPGVANGNWCWRFTWKEIQQKQLKFIEELNTIYNR